MKNLLGFITVIIMVFGLTLGESSGNIQKSKGNKITGASFEDCVKVELIADSDRYELKKDTSISVIVRIINNSDERLKLRDKPIFKFERVNIKEDEKIRPVLGNYYKGFIVSENSSKSEYTFLEKGGHLDFVVNINDLELTDEMNSIAIWLNIFEMLKKGEYNMHAEAFVVFPNNEKTDAKQFLSNKITISYAEGKEK